jgi:hypothetical protein
MLSEPIAVTLQVTEIFEGLSIPYVIGGSMASTAYGRIRTTMDVDIVVDLKLEHVDPLVAALESDFYVDSNSISEAIQQRSSCSFIHLETMFKVDLFVAKDRPFDQLQISRRTRKVLGSEPSQAAYVATAEDIILAKLDWYRLSEQQSERQWQDIQGILQVSGEQLDRGYLRQTSAELGVDEILEQAFQDAKS